ncbi:MAG: autotransporter-associated N-terminal domain-containing protein, partial [Fusobacterium necrophorum]|nr:autotransporter-associated N-terminal domain-containing protein [Fusobacterium necrophorum]
MIRNQLKEVEKNLRYIAKRDKSISFSIGLALLYLMLGMNAFSEEIEKMEAEKKTFLASRQEIGTSTDTLSETLKRIKEENDKKLKGTQLELVQLMEQGDQVVKSPWSSWQFGINYVYANGGRHFKGRGDKNKKYPYEGIFTRSKSIFGRTASPQTPEQEEVLKELLVELGELGEWRNGDPKSAINNNRNGETEKYGLLTRKRVEEKPFGIQISASIRPKAIDKKAPDVHVGEISINPPTPGAIPTPPQGPAAPKIKIPSFAPVAPKIDPPDLPVPPTFAIVLGADCNEGCISDHITPRQTTKDGFLDSTDNKSQQNIKTFLHYTWRNNRLAEKSYAFKMYKETDTKNLPAPDKGDSNTYNFNSYNFGNEFPNLVVNSEGTDKNHQYFFIGGSRFWEIDNHGETDTFEISSGKTVNLGGILTLGLVSQENGATLLNSGTITDKTEKDDGYIKNMKYDTSGEGVGKYLTINGPTETYQIKRSTDGYVGYKVGIAQVEENSRKGWGGSLKIESQQLQNAGIIDFRGERSIGMYIYLPKQAGDSNYDRMVTYAKMLNLQGGNILLSGAESYGMKLAAHSDSKAEMKNTGTITLRRNPEGKDKADNSAAMALMVDKSVKNKVSLDKGKAINEGIINITDNVSNSLGMYVNIDSDMTNKGDINVSANAEKDASGKYKLNVAMRADQVEDQYATTSEKKTTVINEKNITLSGNGAVGMLANGGERAQAENKGVDAKIEITGKDNYGMLATKGGLVHNSKNINLMPNSNNSIGIASLENSKAKNDGTINVNSENATGVYNVGNFTMGDSNASVTVDGKQSIGIYAKGSSGVETNLSGGTITAKNGAVGLYSDQSNIKLNNSGNKLKLIAEDGGLLFYNYESANPTQDTGKFSLESGNIVATVKKGGTGFYLKNATITEQGGITGVPEFLNKMFSGSSSTSNKIKVELDDGGTFLILHKPQGGNMNLSSVGASSLTTALGDKVTLAQSATGTGKYKVYSVYRGGLSINQDVNLDNDGTGTKPLDDFYKVDFLSSKMMLEENQKITGTKDGQMAMFQGNFDEGSEKGTLNDIIVTNKGSISLSGNSITTAGNEKTTTAMAGDFATLTNQGKIEVTGNKGIGIFGAGGSKVLNDNGASIKIGQEGVALFGTNKLGASTLGDKKISLENKGNITAVDGKKKTFGMYAHNDTSIVGIADSKITNAGTIDFSSAEESIGIDVKNSTVKNTGSLKMGKKGVALNADGSDITSSGDITLSGNAIAFNLKNLTGRTLNFTSKVTVSGSGNSVFNLTDTTFDITSSNIIENLTMVAPNGGYSYFSLNNSSLVQNKDKSLSGNKITLVNGKNSTVDWRSNINMTGSENVAFYMKGTKGADPEVKTLAGKTIILGNKSVGAYVEDGARVENHSAIILGENGAALYAKGAGSAITNDAELTIGKNTVGIYQENGDHDKISHTGKILSEKEEAKGIVFKKSSAANFKNAGTINLTGVSSIGVYADGAAHTFENDGNIEVGDSIEGKNQSVAVYVKDSAKVVNKKNIKAGKNSIGIYGYAVTLENASSLEAGDAGIGIFSQGGNLELKNGSKIKIGETSGKNKEAVGVYYKGINGTITNSLTSLDIGKGSIGFVIGGSGNTLQNKLNSVSLKGDSIYTYSTDTTGTINGETKIASIGDLNYGYYVAGNLENKAGADINFSNGYGNVGIYSAYQSGTNGVAKNYAKIITGKTDVEKELYSIGMAAGYYDKDNAAKNKIGHVINEATGVIEVTDANSIGMYAAGQGSRAINKGKIIVKAKNGIGMFIADKAYGENAKDGEIILELGADGAIGAYVTGDAIFKNYGKFSIQSNNSKGIITAAGGTAEPYAVDGTVTGTIEDNGTGNKKVHNVTSTPGGDKEFGNVKFKIKPGVTTPTVIKVNGIPVDPTLVNTETSDPNATVEINPANPLGNIAHSKNPFLGRTNLGAASKIGMYIDTSGVNFTNPIEGLSSLSNLKKADLIIGAEAAEYTNAKKIQVGENILERYNKAIKDNPQIEEWNIISGSLTWAAAPGQMDATGKFKSIVMAKTDYKEYADKSNNAYNFLDGLEQRYDKNTLASKEKMVFNKLNSIGKNEQIILTQAIDEMMGHQYANVQQRIH